MALSLGLATKALLSKFASGANETGAQNASVNGRPRKELIRFAIRPQGNSMVPVGNPSVPPTAPYNIYKAERIKDKKGNPTRFLLVQANAFGEGGTYNEEVQEDLGTGKTWVHCNCPDFVYRFEVADTNRGFSSIQDSNGAYPDKTNPMNVPSLCKHLVQLLQDPIFDNNEKEYANEG